MQIDTLKNINSPQELKGFNREMGGFGARLKSIEKQVEKLEKLHNGSHPNTGIKPWILIIKYKRWAQIPQVK